MPTSPTLDPDAYRLMRAGRFREALPFAERAVAGARSCVPGHGMLATILLQLGRARDAEQVVAHAMALESGTGEAYDGLAYVSIALDRHERANTLYRRATELSPEVPHHWYNLACSERSLGRLAEAEAACYRCIALDPSHYRTYLLRSELRVQTRAANHVDELQSLLADARTNGRARTYLGYALAKELDDVQRFDDAFRWFAESAKARRSQITYDVSGDERKLRRIAEVFPVGTVSATSAARAAASASGGADATAAVGARDDGGARCIFMWDCRARGPH